MFSLEPRLPGAVRVAAVHRYASLLTELLVHAHLPALVVRHAQAYRLRNAQQLVCESLQNVGGCGWLELKEIDQRHQATAALHQDPHLIGVELSFNEIALPMSGEFAVLNLWRAKINAQHVADLASAVLAFAAR